MTSAIVRSNPTSGTATTSSVRDNFGFAADEINVLQRSSTELKLTTGGGSSPYSVNFGSSPTFSLVDGARISVRINATNTSSPNIIVSPGISPVGIVKSDGSALIAGDLVADSIYDLMYNDTTERWVALNVTAGLIESDLLTTVLGGIYPVDGLLTTTKVGDPGTADYFFNGITFGTWEAYAEGRVLVGIDSTDSSFDTIGETGGIDSFTLSNSQMHHNHQWHDNASGSNDHRIELTDKNASSNSFNSAGAPVEFPNASSLSSNYYTNINRTAVTGSRSAVNNLQPYIVTYIWKRTA